MDELIDISNAEKYMNDVITDTLNKTIYDFMIDDVNSNYNIYLEYIEQLKKIYIKDIPIKLKFRENPYIHFLENKYFDIDEINGINVEIYKNEILRNCLGYTNDCNENIIENRFYMNYSKIKFNNSLKIQLYKLNSVLFNKIAENYNNHNTFGKDLGLNKYNNIYVTLFYDIIFNNKLLHQQELNKNFDNRIKNIEDKLNTIQYYLYIIFISFTMFFLYNIM